MRAGLLVLSLLFAAGTQAGELPERDLRNVEIRHTDTIFDLEAPADRGAWLERAAALRKQILFSAGLLPLPPKSPLNPQVFDRVEHDDYSVEKVLIETYPGFFLGGNLYRPVGKQGPFPAVLTPHGHWAWGRLEHSDVASVPARGVNLARQGFVVFAWDMIGYDDTLQLPHGFAEQREQLWMVGALGLQLWNSIRAADFVTSLSDVDPSRIGVTGASGGGTQSFLLTAVDERVRYAAPVNMVSFLMQGGSRCENAPNLRIDTNNVEIAALAAPRPMLVVSATGDWTKNVPRQEFPAIQRIYDLLDSKSRAEVVQFDSPHNYHQGSREAVYLFFGKHGLGDEDPTHFADRRFPVEQPSAMLALWNRRLPEHAVDLETFIAERIATAEEQTEALRPGNAASLGVAREAFRERLGLSLMARSPAPDELLSELLEELPNGEQLVIGRRGKGDRIPTAVLRPRRALPGARPVLIVHPEGAAWTLSSSESRDGFVQELLDRRFPVMAIDAFQTGHAVADRDVAAAGKNAERYYTTFNRTDDARRVQDVMTAIAFARESFGIEDIHLVGFGRAGLWCALAAALTDGPLSLAADLDGFDASSDNAYLDGLFSPGLRRAGDFRAVATLLGPGPTLLSNVAEGFPKGWLTASFVAQQAEQALEVRADGVDWHELVERIAPQSRRGRR